MKQLAISTLLMFIGAIKVPAQQINSGGAVNAATYAKTVSLAPGVIFSVFGSQLSYETGPVVAFDAPDGHEVDCIGTCGPYTLPNDWFLPTDAGGMSAWINGTPAPLFYISPGQMNAQFPVELAGLTSVSIEVHVCCSGSATLISAPITVSVAPFSPGVFTLDQNGSGPGAILRNGNFTKICPPGRKDCASNPAHPGEAVAIYATGLGAVMGESVPSGKPAQLPLQTVVTPVVMIGGIQATVLYSGLAVGFVGLYQVDVAVPASAPTGDAVPLTLDIGGYDANPVTIAIGR